LNENNHDDVLNARISQAEIENAILIIRNDKSSGVDNVTNEYFLNIVSSALLMSIKVQNCFFFVERYKLITLCKIKILSAVE
jgi:hypothetical protein